MTTAARSQYPETTDRQIRCCGYELNINEMRRISIRIVLVPLLIVISASANAYNAVPEVEDSVTVSTERLADIIVDEGMKLIGTPYRYGGNGPKAYDCTGFTKHLYKRFGYDLERSSSGQARQGREVSGSWSNFQKGDLVVFAARRNTSRVGHIGIFIELDSTGRDFTFIHAAVKGGVRISHISEEYYASRFLGARRILPDFVSRKDDLAVEDLPENIVLDVKDTLRLKDVDKRILLMADGRWMIIGDDGTLKSPKDTANIVLSSSGTWSAVKNVTHRIPSKTDPSRQALSADDVSAEDVMYHTIKSGDTLSSIASRYKTSVSALCRLNGITVKTTLRVGKRIRVK